MKKKTVWEMGRVGVDDFRHQPKTPLTVILDNIRSLNNIGSIFRSADGFAVRRIMLCGITACPPGPEIHKTALGAEDSVEWQYFGHTLEAVRHLQENGVTVAALEQTHGSVSLEAFRPEPGREYAIVAGNEVDGVDQAVVDACDFCLEIPQSGTKHSLNVAVSTAIAMWQFYQSYKH